MLANLLLMAQVVVPLVVCEPTHMLLVEGSLDGTPCTLVFDTGATHTSFDEEFIAKALPEAHPEPVMLAGTSNANFVPKIAMSKTLKVGEVAFEGYPVMAIPFRRYRRSLGGPSTAFSAWTSSAKCRWCSRWPRAKSSSIPTT